MSTPDTNQSDKKPDAKPEFNTALPVLAGAAIPFVTFNVSEATPAATTVPPLRFDRVTRAMARSDWAIRDARIAIDNADPYIPQGDAALKRFEHAIGRHKRLGERFDNLPHTASAAPLSATTPASPIAAPKPQTPFEAARVASREAHALVRSQGLTGLAAEVVLADSNHRLAQLSNEASTKPPLLGKPPIIIRTDLVTPTHSTTVIPSFNLIMGAIAVGATVGQFISGDTRGAGETAATGAGAILTGALTSRAMALNGGNLLPAIQSARGAAVGINPVAGAVVNGVSAAVLVTIGATSARDIFNALVGTPNPLAPVPISASMNTPEARRNSVPAPSLQLDAVLGARAASTPAQAARPQEREQLSPIAREGESRITTKQGQILSNIANSGELQWAQDKVRELLPNAPKMTVLSVLTIAMANAFEPKTGNINNIRAGQEIVLTASAIETIVKTLGENGKIDRRNRLTNISDSGELSEILGPKATPVLTAERNRSK